MAKKMSLTEFLAAEDIDCTEGLNLNDQFEMEKIREHIEHLVHLAENELENAKYIFDHLPYHVDDQNAFLDLLKSFNLYMDRAESELHEAEEESKFAPHIICDEELVAAVRGVERYFEELRQCCESSASSMDLSCRPDRFRSSLKQMH